MRFFESLLSTALLITFLFSHSIFFPNAISFLFAPNDADLRLQTEAVYLMKIFSTRKNASNFINWSNCFLQFFFLMIIEVEIDSENERSIFTPSNFGCINKPAST